jgi:hypothetical protein
MKFGRKACLGIIFAGIAPWCTAQINLESPSSIAQLGAGYDSFTGSIRGDCIDGAEAEQQTQGQRVDINVLHIKDEREFSQVLNITVKAKYGLFNAGASSVTESTFNSFSTYLVVRTIVDVRTWLSKRPKLLPRALALATSNPARFREQCGNNFVRSITRGGEYSALVEVFSSTQAERNDIKLKADGAAGIFKTSADAAKSISSIVKGYRYAAKLVRAGGRGKVGASSEEILGDALAFPMALEKALDKDLFTSRVEVQEYLTLLDLPVKFDKTVLSDTEKLLRLERFDAMAVQRRQHLADIQYILKYPEQFAPHDAAPIRVHEQGLRSTLFDMKSAVAMCLDATLKKCSAADLREPPATFQVALPARIPGPTNEEVLTTQIAGLQARISRSSAAINALLDNGFPEGRNVNAPNVGGCNQMPLGGAKCTHVFIQDYCTRVGCVP